MDKTPKIFLLHILDAISQIEQYVSGLSYDEFALDRKTQDAAIRQLEIIGEASRNLENSFKENRPEIPWREIADFRNVLAHEYWDIDLDIIWKAINDDVPNLKKALSPLIETS
jgi:uncharacterized protein with HEPN domain